MSSQVYDLTILSIFRESAHYLERYFSQVFQTFQDNGGRCHAIWLEGDSKDNTYPLLCQKKQLMQKKGHAVTLIKFDNHGPLWPSRNIPQRWEQIANCWNKCTELLTPTKIAICVESDLIWDPKIVPALIHKLSDIRHVIYPMLMLDNQFTLFGEEIFNDTWGFERRGKKFQQTKPYWPQDSILDENDHFLEITTGGGMIVSTYDCFKQASWDLSCCILKFNNKIKLFMDKDLRIYHPLPKDWNYYKKLKLQGYLLKEKIKNRLKIN